MRPQNRVPCAAEATNRGSQANLCTCMCFAGAHTCTGGDFMAPFRILLADDHEVVRAGLRALLEEQQGWEVVAEAVDGREAVEKATKLKPDVVVIDIAMPSLNGLEAV